MVGGEGRNPPTSCPLSQVAEEIEEGKEREGVEVDVGHLVDSWEELAEENVPFRIWGSGVIRRITP